MRSNFVSVVLLTFVGVLAHSQTPHSGKEDGCPIDILRVWKSSDGEYVRTDAISAEYTNTSSKDIVAIKFGALLFNALDEPSDSYTNYLDDSGLKWDAKRAAQSKDQKPTVGTWQ